MAERAKDELATAVAVLEQDLGAELMTAPVDGLSPQEGMQRLSVQSMRQMLRIVEQPLDMHDLKQQRLIGDMAHASLKLMQRAAEGQFKMVRDERLVRLLEEIEAEKKGGK